MMATGQELVDGYLERLATATGDLPPDVREELVTDVRTHLLEVQERAGSDVDVREALDRLGTPESIAAEARGGSVASAATGASSTPPEAGVGWTPPPPVPGTAWRAPAPPQRRTSSLGYDATALLTLLFGGVLLGFLGGILGWLGGWVLGLALVWSSRTWSSSEKALATVVWPGGYLLPMIVGLVSTQVCTSGGELTITDELADGTVQTFVEPAVAEQCIGFTLPLWLAIPLVVVLVAAPIAVAWLLLKRGDKRRAAERQA